MSIRTIYYTFATLLTLILINQNIYSQNIKGRVIDAEELIPISDALIHNIHSGEKTISDENGYFQITGEKEELIEITVFGYKTVRIRLYENPKKFLEIKMYIQAHVYDEVVIYENNPNRKVDSIITAEIFNKSLEFKKLDPMESFRHPLTALSKHNRRIWEFQERYKWMEKEKFIEYTFNDKLIQNLTQLGTDSIPLYKLKFRPQYEWFEIWTNYQYYEYIKKTVDLFRRNSKYYNFTE